MYAHFPEYFLLLQPLINNCKCKLNCENPLFTLQNHQIPMPNCTFRCVEWSAHKTWFPFWRGVNKKNSFEALIGGPPKEANK
jgi:hypothetical protein